MNEKYIETILNIIKTFRTPQILSKFKDLFSLVHQVLSFYEEYKIIEF